MSDQLPSVFQAALARGLVSRRTAMAGMAGLAGVAGLAACGSAGKNPTAGSTGGATTKSRVKAATDTSDTDKLINWSNWPSYMDIDEKTKSHPTLVAFTKKTGIKVNYTEDYNDNDEFYAKVRPLLEAGSDTGRDVWVSTDWMVARLIRQDYVQKFDLANIPNHANVEDSLLNVPFDKGRLYSLPWQSGFTGIAWNPKSTGGKKIETIDQLFTDPKLKGKVTLLSEMRDTVGLTLIAMGKDPATFTTADFDAACAEIQKAKDAGQIKGFTGNDYTKPLASGDTAACLAWAGDVVQLKADNPSLGYALPEKGFIDLVGQLRDPQPGQAQEERRDDHQLLLRPRGDGPGRGLRQLHLPRQGGEAAAAQERSRRGSEPVDHPVAGGPVPFPSLPWPERRRGDQLQPQVPGDRDGVRRVNARADLW